MITDFRVSSQDHASTPPRGWNSYDSFIWTISEEEFLQSSDIISKQLLPHGYEVFMEDDNNLIFCINLYVCECFSVILFHFNAVRCCGLPVV